MTQALAKEAECAMEAARDASQIFEEVAAAMAEAEEVGHAEAMGEYATLAEGAAHDAVKVA
eukprot:2493929-Pyramimonas_sp.AAC.1